MKFPQIVGGTCLSGPLSRLDHPSLLVGHDKRAPPKKVRRDPPVGSAI
ncbi:hypothetical protein THTE_0099 [Thermogutta terrifontis]|uniref:Uncharacterized protein n=1 Tax=Thermogutta terrifontis TaxID=1331910 RepID=A0A286R9S1_9BACT|nr:hypothetical protein THTE_0099 [Thermogutta terrifontis]